MAFLINITYCIYIYITYLMIHFLPSEPSCDHPKLDNPLFSLRFNDQQSSKCRWICTNVPEIQKDLPQIQEDLPLESLSLMRNLGFTLQPLSKLKWVFGRDLLYQGDPYAFFVPGVVFFLYLGFGTIYSTECLCHNERCGGIHGSHWVSRFQDWRRGGDVPVVPGSGLPNI